MRRLLLVASLAVAGCSLITDFNPSRGGGGDARAADGAPTSDARVDAPIPCTNSNQCNDGIACTVDSCAPTNPAAGQNGCVHTPGLCGTGQVCDPALGCVTGQCLRDVDCPPLTDCCKRPFCRDDHTCHDTDVCPAGTHCVQTNGVCSCAI